eukprot:11357469-Heterocapsa_arctica.AAC.1
MGSHLVGLQWALLTPAGLHYVRHLAAPDHAKHHLAHCGGSQGGRLPLIEQCFSRARQEHLRIMGTP